MNAPVDLDRRTRVTRILPGALVAVGVSALCLALTAVAPAAPALLIAILLGALARGAGWIPVGWEPGLAWAARFLLRAGVVLLGLQLSVGDLLRLGWAEVVVLAVTVCATFGATLWLGRRLRVGRALTLLVATGFSICGAAAVAGMSPVAGADEEDVATAVALVTVYGSVAIVALPVLSRVIGLDDRTAGLWAGMSVHEVAQVVAAAGTVSAVALTIAIVAKLARVLLLAPLVTGVGVVRRRRSSTVAERTAPLIPGFVIGFVLAVLLRTTGVLPDVALGWVKPVTTLALGAAMVGLGSQIHLGRLIRTGGRPLALGGLATLVAGGVSLAGLLLV
ncbi:putative sulfate exporter family transporter [Cellulomonas sp. NPDC089187]|uniref:YeiH family protein n=1 Tax=Cellulomonas sp. NPDC089187 TaxID=3154970 RepID=UPI00343F45D1